MTPSRASSSATARGSWSTLSDSRRASSATSVSSASRPASRSASGSNRGSRRASPRASWSATAAVSRAPAPSCVSASRSDAAPRAIASPCWAAVRRPRISSASPARSRAPAISAASCSSRSSRRATSRGSSAAASSAARFSRQRSTAPAIARRSVLVAAEAIEQVALPALVEQSPLVVLAVDLDEGADLVRQPRRGHGRVVEAGRGPAARGDLADRDQRLRQSIEQRLHPRGLGAVAHERPCPRGRPSRARGHRSAGSCRRRSRR